MSTLIELLMVCEDISTDGVLKIAARSLMQTLHHVDIELDEALKWKDGTKAVAIMRPLYSWFTQNYTDNKGYNIREKLLKLKDQYKRYHNVVSPVLSLPSLPKDSPDYVSVEYKILTLANTLSQISDMMYRDSKLSNDLVRLASSVANKVKSLRKFRFDPGVDNVQRPTPKQPNIVSAQNQQVEVVINQILSDLPDKISGEIRQAISKSDNKLAALSAEMKKRGL